MKFNTFEMTKLKIETVKKIVAKKIKIKEASFMLDVSRQSIGKWVAIYKLEGEHGLLPKKSGPKSGHAYNKTDIKTENHIIKIAQENPFKGPDWIADELYSHHEIKLNQSTVYRILKRSGVRYYTNYRHKRRKKKKYCLDMPGREIQLDTCYPFGYQKKAIVYDAIDDCSRWVFARVMENKTEETTIEFLKELIQKAPFNIEAIRTDRGTEFSSNVEEFLRQQGIELRRNPAYTPQHNGKIERYHRTFKEDSVSYWNFNASLDELNYELTKWLSYYNYNKRHTGLGMNKMTPVEKLTYAMIYKSFNPNLNVNLILQQNKF
jgi:transposase InsO family protein